MLEVTRPSLQDAVSLAGFALSNTSDCTEDFISTRQDLLFQETRGCDFTAQYTRVLLSLHVYGGDEIPNLNSDALTIAREILFNKLLGVARDSNDTHIIIIICL